MNDIQRIIKEELRKIGIAAGDASLEHPKTLAHGDYSFFLKDKEIDPAGLALNKISHEYIQKVEIAGRFINFHLSAKFFSDSLTKIIEEGEDFGKNTKLSGEKIIIEYTDPNPFKEFHIGHLMSNTIGESLSRIIEWSGAEVKRACYQGDIGLHVAKAIWAMKKISGEKPSEEAALAQKVAFLGKAYALGARSYEEDENFKKEIDALNKIIYEKTNAQTNELYDWGRKVSLDHLKEIYAKLGTHFDYFFFESEAAPLGLFIIEEFLGKGIFEKSEGAIIFKGEKYGLHTRVFVTSQGLPTYETKELGLSKMKFSRGNWTRSIMVTANEQSEYFRVILKALEFIDQGIANKTRHIAHGMLRFASGKMSSRKGNVITGESMIEDVEALVHEKIKERNLTGDERKIIASVVAVGAIKYSILKQAIGRDIIFDFEKSLSFEGDSGPYLQYSFARANSVLEKAAAEKIEARAEKIATRAQAGGGGEAGRPSEVSEIVKLLYRFSEIVERARDEYAPKHITVFLTQIAAAFNNFYANNQIVNARDKNSAHRVALTAAFAAIMKNGLHLLGIAAPEKM